MNIITLDTPRLVADTCPRCHATAPPTRGPGAGPHHARLVCGTCGRFLRWLPTPRVGQEVRHG